MQTQSADFYLPNDVELTGIIGKITAVHPTIPEASQSITLCTYDTFDWRLYRNALVLTSQNNKYSLRELDTAVAIVQETCPTPPVFADDFPAGALRERAAPILGVRALLEMACAGVTRTTYPLLNEDEKTVARLVVEEIRPSPPAAPLIAIHLHPLRGYEKEAQAISQRLQDAGLIPGEGDDIYRQIMAAAGKTPGGYTPKPPVPLTPEMRADEAAKQILRAQLKVIRSNEPYIAQDIDTEFLHDFRVAIRRTRSALTQIKGVFPADVTARFKQDLATVGKMTNQLRDLDVYLLDEARYRAMLPENLAADIGPLFAYLRQKRTAVLADVIANLNSPQYRQIMADWEAFLNEPVPENPTAPHAARPIIKVARKRIFKRYRQIVAEGREILENTEDHLLHALRIDCKKLRYLLEFFTPLFPPEEIAYLIKQLKQLQTNLGDFNDLCVQEDYLLHVADELPLARQQSRHTLMAIGGLVAILHQERLRVKAEFAQTFAAFTAPANSQLFTELFASGKRKGA